MNHGTGRRVDYNMKKIICSLLITVLAITSVPFLSQTTYAQAPVTYSLNNIMFFDPYEPCIGGDAKLSGGSNEEKVFAWLTSEQQGFNAAQAAGMMGNMNTESSFNPFRMQTTYSNSGIEAVLPVDAHSEYNKAFGLVQWDGGRRQQILSKIAEKFPSYIADINAYGKSADGYKEAVDKNDAYLIFELEFMNQELSEGYKHVYDEIRAQPNTEEGVVNAAEIWNRKYEVSGDYSQDRHNKGKEYFAQFKDAVIADADTTAAGCTDGEPASEIVWYSQTDPRWASIGYAGGTMAELGCGPTSMAMILAGLVDKTITPKEVAAEAGEQVGSTNHANLIKGVTAKWGVTIKEMNFDEAVAFLEAGKGYVWVGGTGNPPFTPSPGHMVAMSKASADTVTIADPIGEAPGHQKVAEYPKAQINASATKLYGVSK